MTLGDVETALDLMRQYEARIKRSAESVREAYARHAAEVADLQTLVTGLRAELVHERAVKLKAVS